MTARGGRPVLRWGVLSTANIGVKAVLPAIRASRNGGLVAVASRDLGRAQAVARELGIPRAYGTYEALLADPEIDAVYIPLPNNLHRPWTIRALVAGKHVLCEKPLGLNASEAEEMAEAAQRSGRLLMEAFMYRFHPRFEALLGLVRGGAIGELKVIRSSFTFRLERPGDIRLEPKLGGGALYDVGCYCLNAARTVTGEEPEGVAAQARWTARGVDESLTALLRFPSGVLAHFDCSLAAAGQEFLQLVGSRGRLELERAFVVGREESSIALRREGQADELYPFPSADKYRLMVEDFADCAIKGGRLRYPAADGVANMRAIDRLYREARQGRVENRPRQRPEERQD